jgi:hypothetical protein
VLVVILFVADVLEVDRSHHNDGGSHNGSA